MTVKPFDFKVRGDIDLIEEEAMTEPNAVTKEQMLEKALASLVEQFDAYRKGWMGQDIWRDRIGLPADLAYACRALIAGTGGEAVEYKLRPEVGAFAMLMEAELRKNDDRPGWKKERLTWLSDRLDDEHGELSRAIEDKAGAAEISKEAADVANFAMMIADVAGGLKPVSPSPPQALFRACPKCGGGANSNSVLHCPVCGGTGEVPDLPAPSPQAPPDAGNVGQAGRPTQGEVEEAVKILDGHFGGADFDPAVFGTDYGGPIDQAWEKLLSAYDTIRVALTGCGLPAEKADVLILDDEHAIDLSAPPSAPPLPKEVEEAMESINEVVCGLGPCELNNKGCCLSHNYDLPPCRVKEARAALAVIKAALQRYHELCVEVGEKP